MSYDNDFIAKAEANLTMNCQLSDLHLKASTGSLQVVHKTGKIELMHYNYKCKGESFIC